MKRFAFVLALISAPLFAVEPDEILDDPVLEERARAISKDVRCVVCQNEPIDSSNAGVARDLRILIRERLVAGDSDAEVKAYLVARYGEYVLFKPPFKPSTYALWLAPIGLIGLGAIAAGVAFSRRGAARRADGLSDEDEARVDALIAQFTDEDAPRGSGEQDKT